MQCTYVWGKKKHWSRDCNFLYEDMCLISYRHDTWIGVFTCRLMLLWRVTYVIIYLKWLHVDKTLYMQVHVLRCLKYKIEKKTYTDHRAIFLETCLGSFQMFSYHSNGKLQPATILVSESSFQPACSNREKVAQ